MKVLIIHNKLSENALADEADVLEQVKLVEDALILLNHEVSVLSVSLDLLKAVNEIRQISPDLIFNLVESFENKGELVYFAPAVIDILKIPYTGTHTVQMFQSSSKTLTKNILIRNEIPTPDSFEINDLQNIRPDRKYILKPRWEEGSLGLDEDAVFRGDDSSFIQQLNRFAPRDYFIEEFVEGREFNCALLATKDGPRVLAVAEIEFIDFPEGKPKMLGFKAKWDEESFEYTNTVRRLDFDENDNDLLFQLGDLAKKCWVSCDLRGYARVDFRVDLQGNPFVLEVNSNPCISPDSGYFAAAAHAGLSFTEVVALIVEDAFRFHQE
ncbi:MAG: ATP-grasp domain-containing protein [Bacteroidales bacterium]|nr:ATP-grasp domain-containing protein [Bacteroidales bacterium]